jgi:hypothetical protein
MTVAGQTIHRQNSFLIVDEAYEYVAALQLTLFWRRPSRSSY